MLNNIKATPTETCQNDTSITNVEFHSNRLIVWGFNDSGLPSFTQRLAPTHHGRLEIWTSSIWLTTRTTRTLAFWGYPLPPLDYPYYWVILDPKSKEDKVKVTNLKNLPKFQIFKHEMDLMSIVEDTERKRFCPQTDGQTAGRMDRQTRWNHYPSFNFVEVGDIMILAGPV